MTLTAVQREIAAIRALPEPERAARALALVPDLDDVLADDRVAEETSARVWVSLARAAGRHLPAGAGRQAVLDALAAEPVDWPAEVRAATTALAAAHRRHREVAVAARRAGMGVEALAECAGVSRQTISAWRANAENRRSAGQPSVAGHGEAAVGLRL